MPVVPLQGQTPRMGKDVFLAPNAYVIGNVQIGDRSSIWYNVTIRGDVFAMRLGREVNVQDGSVLHGTYGKCGVVLHDRVTIGHLAMLHGCEVGEGSLIGMGSVLLDNCRIGKNSLVAAGSLIKEGEVFPDGVLIAGRPAVVKRNLTQQEIEKLQQSADNYLLYKSWYEDSPSTKQEAP